jgi:hypothetical protein
VNEFIYVTIDILDEQFSPDGGEAREARGNAGAFFAAHVV